MEIKTEDTSVAQNFHDFTLVTIARCNDQKASHLQQLLRGYVIGRAEHGRSMDMGGAMHAPRCMLRASILSVGGCRDAEHARRARSKSPTVTETRMGRLKYEEQIQEDHGKQRDGFRTQ